MARGEQYHLDTCKGSTCNLQVYITVGVLVKELHA